jgi:DNA polymerase/3'-5' exonuclease PolX
MSNKQRWPATSAHKVADELVAELAPRCERIDIAGSLRRGKADVGDIEILYVPRIGQVHAPGELFPKRGSLADELLNQWLAKGIIRKRPNVNGSVAWGELNKLAIHVASGIPIDLFATTMQRWFVSLVMRTGSAQSNTRLANAALRSGMQFHAYGVIQDSSGQQIIPQSEREVFERLGVSYREPAER